MITLPGLTVARLATATVERPDDDGEHVRVLRIVATPEAAPTDTSAQGGLAGESLTARLALAVPYQPASGDEVLLVGEDDRWFVIGVLRFADRAVVAYPVPVTVESTEGITVHAPRVTAEASRLEVFAGTLWQRVTTAFEWVRDLLQRRAGRSRTLVDGQDYTRTGRTIHKSKGDVQIDGDQIHLG